MQQFRLPVVIKSDPLPSGGKAVFIVNSVEEAKAAIDQLFKIHEDAVNPINGTTSCHD